MPIEAANLFVKIGADTSEMDSAFGGIGKQFSSFGNTLGKVAFGAVAAGMAGVGAGFKYVTDEAKEGEEGLAQLNAVIKSTGGVAGVTSEFALDLADSLQQVTPFADDATIAGENMLLTFTNIGRNVFPQATEIMLDMSQALGQDVKGSAMQLGKALNDPIAGVTALRRVGVQLTDEQELQVKAMMKVNDVAGAQGVILAELTKEFGGSARAAGETSTGQWAIFQHQVEKVAGSIGDIFLPMMNKATGYLMSKLPEVIGFVNDSMIPAIQNIGDEIDIFFENLSDTRGIVEGVRSAFLGLLTGVFSESVATGVSDFFANTLGWIINNKDVIIGALKGIGAALLGFMAFSTLGTIIGALSNPITAVMVAAGLLGAAWETNFLGMRDILTGVWNEIGPIFEGIIGYLLGVIEDGDTFNDWLTHVPDVVRPFLGAFGEVLATLQGIFEVLSDGVQPGDVEKIMGTLGSLRERIKAWTDTIDWGGMLTSLLAKVNEINTAIDTWSKTPEVQSAFENAGKTVGELAGKGVRLAVELAIVGIGEWFKNGGFEKALNPEETGRTLAQTLVKGITEGFIAGLLGVDVSPQVSEWVTLAIQKGFYISNPAMLIVQAIGEIINNVRALCTADWGAIGAELGGSMMDGIRNGISNGVSWIIDAARNAAQQAFDAARDLLGIHSPSKLFAGIGENMMAGMAQGIDQFKNMPVGVTLKATNDLSTTAIGSQGKTIATSRGGGQPSSSDLSQLVSLFGGMKSPSARDIGREVAKSLMQAGAIG